MKPTVSGELTFLNMLLILFIAFKLAGVIAWSWWWVLSPLWISGGLILIGAVILGLVKK